MIEDLRQNTIWTIPCHRHCDAFYILKMMGYKKNVDYKEIAQGFLDENDVFYNRVDAWKHAWQSLQLPNSANINTEIRPTELFSEDLW